MTRSAAFMALLILASTACGATGPGPSADASAAGSESCACTVVDGQRVYDLACACKGGCPALAQEVAEAKAATNGACYQIREYASCGRTVIGHLQSRFAFPSRRVFDTATGKLIGAQYTADVLESCPGRPDDRAFVTVMGASDEPSCPMTACTGKCAADLNFDCPTVFQD